MKYTDLFMIFDKNDEVIDFVINITDLSSYQSWVFIDTKIIRTKKLNARILAQRTFE